MLHLKLAIRNLFRQRARLILNLILLAGAFSAIVVFKGFKEYILDTMEDIMVKTQYGNLQVAKKKFWDNVPVDYPTEKMLEGAASWNERLKSVDGIKTISPRVNFYGLVNTADKSLPTHLIGFEPKAEQDMQNRLQILEGGRLTGRKQILIGGGLQKLLKLKAGDEVTVVSPTLEGGINAMDLQVAGIFATGFTEIDNSTAYLPLLDAQKLLDSDFFEKLYLTINKRGDETAMASQVSQQISDPTIEVKSWRQLADLHIQVENFYNFQNYVIEAILLILLILSVSNTMNMTVVERLPEIGTMRAMGDDEGNIRYSLFIESVLMALIAIALGLPISSFIAGAISSLEIPLVLPMASQPLPVKVTPPVWAFVEASIVCFLAVVLAGIWPARKGSRVPIVNALKAKI